MPLIWNISLVLLKLVNLSECEINEVMVKKNTIEQFEL